MKRYDLYKDGIEVAHGITIPTICYMLRKSKKYVSKRVYEYRTLGDGYETVESE